MKGGKGLGRYEGRYLSSEVADALRPYVLEHDNNHHWSMEGGEPNGNGQLCAARWLEFETGLSEETIRQVLTCRRKTVRGRTADALLTAVGRPDILGTLTEVDLHGRVRTPRPARKVQRVSDP